MVEHHSGVEFLRYRRILKLGIESPDDALFSILDKNIFHYIYNSKFIIRNLKLKNHGIKQRKNLWFKTSKR